MLYVFYNKFAYRFSAEALRKVVISANCVAKFSYINVMESIPFECFSCNVQNFILSIVKNYIKAYINYMKKYDVKRD